MKSAEQKLQALGTLKLSCGIKYEDWYDISQWCKRGFADLDDKQVERIHSIYKRFFQE